MTTASRFRNLTAAAGLALLGLGLGACSSGSSPVVTVPTGTVRFEAGEQATTKAVDAFVSGTGSAYNRAVGSSGSSAQALGGLLGADRIGMASQASCDSLTLRYYTAQGQEQAAYNGATTVRITAKGPCTTTSGPVNLDVTADDAQASSSTVLLNGTAQGTYEGYNVQAVVTNVRITKQFCGAPASGVIVATTSGLSANIRFDGSLNAQATYTWNGIGVSFTVALQPCS
jgi:hypothetical protein